MFQSRWGIVSENSRPAGGMILKSHRDGLRVGCRGLWHTQPITGNVVCARVVLKAPEDLREFTHKLKAFCATRPGNFKVPIRVFVEEKEVHSPCFKKMRSKDIGKALTT
jgi:hypothetical protein